MQKFIGIQNGNPQEILRVGEVEATLWVEAQTTDLRIPGDVYLVEQDHQDNIVGETSSKIMGLMTIRHSLSPLHAECMELELPSRLYGEGLEPQELMTSKRYEKWFTFARRPLRFGLQEYHAVIGLKVKREKNSGLVTWKDDDDRKKKHLEESKTWTWVNRVRLIYLCVIMGVVMGRDEKVNIPHLYMKLAIDLEKLQNYPWGLYSFDFLLKQIDKTRHKLEQKEGYLMERFLFGFQIWIMEALPALGEICGTKVSKNFTDIIGVENLFPEKGILHSFMEFHIDGAVLLATDFVQKDEKKDERGVKEATSSEFKEAGEEKGEDQVADTERSENSHVAENVDGTTDVSGRNKRKHADRGAESRKKNVLCQLAASSKGNIDTDMKNFLEGLVQASFTTFGEKFCEQFSDRLGKIETEVTQLRTASERSEQFETVVIDRLGKIEAEVTQLRTTLVVTELVGKSDQASGPTMTKINTGPSTSKKDTTPSKKKAFLESCMKNLLLDTFVKSLDPSQAKVEDSLDLLELPKSLKKPADSLDWLKLPKSLKKLADSLELPKSLKKPAIRLDDRDMELDGEDDPDRCLVFVHPADFKKMQDWQNTRTAIQIDPSMLDGELAGRIMSEIDAVMYVFRERTTLKRWNIYRVAFMTCVFSDLIAKDYHNFCKGIKKYTMDPLLLEYGKGGLPSHGRTRMLWNVDVDRMYVPVFDCGGRKRIKEVEAFAHLLPRIVKIVQSLTVQKHLIIIPYTVSYVPMSGLNRLNCHCGVYTIKHIECHVFGLDISLVSDDNIRGAQIKIMWDMWEAANDPELIERMSKYEPIKCSKPAEYVEIDDL
ncbi:PREDICTED: uncharacterized protein LOC106331819 [Brassica oleracea var. oleracea]|uniref:uncharacterized protein LOC106331819 n=1 Tax=Brassica oleracea var. oleracea TaxID=109376 RepID=UPI0006A6E012|nr:PREDICTED: uncharacterized protein LOC106331819 [Brassica oleracea var. oleracea]